MNTEQDNPVPPPPQAPAPRFGAAAPRRTMPLLCVHSATLAKVPYFQLGDIASQLGFDGVDLTVLIGGHVDPRVTNVDLVRAFESIRGSGLEVPMITTNLTGPQDTTAFPVLYLTGRSQVPLFRMGYWSYGTTVPIRQRLIQARQDLLQLLPSAQRSNICAMIHNRAGGFIGQSIWDTESLIAIVEPRLVGYCYDPAEATIEGGLGGWETGLRLALPRLKALVLQDFKWEKGGSGWRPVKCPLGEGMVDWDQFFSIVAGSGFAGPVSIYMNYTVQDSIGALGRDLEFARRGVQRAWSPTPR
jgi:sugar phosphate isomerase/epimerase